MEEDLKLDFTFEIKLKRLCLVKIATSLWERRDIKQKIRLFFQDLSPNLHNNILIRNWHCYLTTKVIPLVNNFSLPSVLINILKHFISSIGSQILYWTKFLTKSLEFEISCTETLFWTHYGTIDKIKIFKYWFDYKKLNTSQLFNVSCIFCLEEYVPLLWNEIPDEVKKSEFYTETIYKFSVYALIIYWKKRLGEEIKEHFVYTIHIEEWEKIVTLRRAGLLTRDQIYHKKMDWLEYCNDSLSIEENMYRGAIIEGLDLAVQYFWNNLDEIQQKRDFDDLLETIDRNRKDRGYSEVLLFMVTKMKVNNNFPILYPFSLWKTFLDNFPYEEFFIPVLSRVLQVDKRTRMLENKCFWSLIGKILNRIDDECSLYNIGGDSVYEKILQEMWEMIPQSSRKWVTENPSSYIQRGLQRRCLYRL